MHAPMLALAIIAIVIMAILADADLSDVVLAAALVFIAAELWKRRELDHTREKLSMPCDCPPSTSVAPAMPPAPLMRAPPCEPYPGAIDTARTCNSDSSQFGSYRDRDDCDNSRAPCGDPFVASRDFAPPSGSPCFDDEANDEEYDGDERNAYQARSRGDPIRAIVGSMNRLCDMNPFVREELEETADLQWWGRHEI